MKKLLSGAGILLLALSVSTVHAQQSMIGIKGGASETSVTDLKGKGRFTGHVGVFFHQELNKNWCIQPEILYAGGGQQFTNDEGNRRILALDYVQVPVMFQYFPIKQFYLEVGPQAGLLINAKTQNTDGGDKGAVSVKDGYKKGDFAVNAGAGINFTKNFGVYARYNFGLTDDTKDDATYRRYRGLQFGAAIRF